MVAKLPASSSADTTAVLVDFDAKDKGNCGGCKVLVYIGGTAPTSTSQFTSIANAPSSWTPYNHSGAVIGSSDVYVALGLKETLGNLPASVGFDCVKIDITP